MYALTLELPIFDTDANKILRGNKFAHSAHRQRVKSLISKLCLGKQPSSPLTSFQITATRHSARFLDYDNLITSLKPFLDGLKLAKVIKDDNWNFIRRENYFPDQIKSNERKIVIKVEEVNDRNTQSIFTVHQNQKKRKKDQG